MSKSVKLEDVMAMMLAQQQQITQLIANQTQAQTQVPAVAANSDTLVLTEEQKVKRAEAIAKRQRVIEAEAVRAEEANKSPDFTPFVQAIQHYQIVKNLPFWIFRTRSDLEYNQVRLAMEIEKGARKGSEYVGFSSEGVIEDPIVKLEARISALTTQMFEFEVMFVYHIRQLVAIQRAMKLEKESLPDFILNAMQTDIGEEAYQKFAQEQDDQRAALRKKRMASARQSAAYMSAIEIPERFL